MARWVGLWLLIAAGSPLQQKAVEDLRRELPGLDDAHAACVVTEIVKRVGESPLELLAGPNTMAAAEEPTKLAVLGAFSKCKAWTPIFAAAFEQGGFKLSKKASKCLDKLFVENESMLMGMISSDAEANDDDVAQQQFTGLLMQCFTKDDFVKLIKAQEG
jgi:hypothetical protein